MFKYKKYLHVYCASMNKMKNQLIEVLIICIYQFFVVTLQSHHLFYSDFNKETDTNHLLDPRPDDLILYPTYRNPKEHSMFP